MTQCGSAIRGIDDKVALAKSAGIILQRIVSTWIHSVTQSNPLVYTKPADVTRFPWTLGPVCPLFG